MTAHLNITHAVVIHVERCACDCAEPVAFYRSACECGWEMPPVARFDIAQAFTAEHMADVAYWAGYGARA